MKIALFSDIHANLPALEAFSKMWMPAKWINYIVWVTW